MTSDTPGGGAAAPNGGGGAAPNGGGGAAPNGGGGAAPNGGSARSLGRRLRARAFRVVNVPMRAILGLPFATPLGRNLMLVFVIGRKTGKTYRQPLSYVRDGETLLTPGGGRWKLNLAGGTPVRIRLRGQDIRVIPELVSDIDEVDRLLTVMVAASSRAAAFTGIARTPDGGFDRASLEKAVRNGLRIVRWHPLETAGPD